MIREGFRLHVYIPQLNGTAFKSLCHADGSLQMFNIFKLNLQPLRVDKTRAALSAPCDDRLTYVWPCCQVLAIWRDDARSYCLERARQDQYRRKRFRGQFQRVAPTSLELALGVSANSCPGARILERPHLTAETAT